MTNPPHSDWPIKGEDGQPLSPSPFVVGIGASAGGLDAFKMFFAGMPANSGMAFLLVQHLDPDFASALVPIVGGFTAMPVQAAEDGIEIAPDHVYVIPPDAIMTVKNRTLHLDRPASPVARRGSVNTFLSSLAADQGKNAIGIILSGFGSDGALGIAAIKEQGGLTLAQAEFDHHAKSGMPQSAASSGFVDHVLAVQDMPGALLDYQRHRTISDAGNGEENVRVDLASHLPAICAVLHGRLGRDFSHYKAGTLMRRIQRRMHVLQTRDVTQYLEQLRTVPTEAELLFREILIGVTRFFRDADAFEILEDKIIPEMLADPDNVDAIRVWIPGCATGEEAFSIAILLREALVRTGARRTVQIFATDLDDHAIDAARSGLYLAAIATDISAERLEQNFHKEDGHYRVSKDIRDMCLFSIHDVVKDPPFSKLDLVSCRNLMIYFEPHLQQRVLTTFHYALRPGGTLFLGPSESVTAQSRLFKPVDKRHRIYARKDTPAAYPAVSGSRSPPGAMPIRRQPPPHSDDIERRAARAIAPYAPAFVVVDRQHDVLRFSGHTIKYLEPAGVASLNLFHLLHPDLRTTVRATLKEAATTGEPALTDGVSIRVGNQYEAVNLIVAPISDQGEGAFYVVAFQPVIRAAPDSTGRAEAAHGDGLAALNRELAATRERLRNLSEELESANEELQSSNEEYLSVNEELQSTNEELETSKEELQSLNEELQTINAELNNRNDSLVRSNSDLTNLFDSTSIATLFLDNDLRIRRFTPPLLEIFNVREGDEGRPISDIVTRLTRDGLFENVRQVLRTLAPIEREVMVKQGASYLMQIRPYRGANDVVDGAVVSFVDISERKRSEQARSQLAAIVESSQDAIISHDLAGVIDSWNSGAENLYGYSAEEAIGQSFAELLGGSVPRAWPDVLSRLQAGERIEQIESVQLAKAGTSVEAALTISPITERDGRISGASVVARDIGERRAAEARASLLLGELDHRVKNILQIVSAVVVQTLRTTPTPQEFATEIEGRVKAIAAAHSLLTQGGEGAMSLRAIFDTEFAPYQRGPSAAARAVVVGDRDVALAPRAGMSIAMAVHELVSNAAKYGALSTDAGQIRVTWSIADLKGEPALNLTWAEQGGPTISAPTRRGFGTTLIERTLTHELDAKVTRAFEPAGLSCTILLPLKAQIGQIAPVPDDNG